MVSEEHQHSTMRRLRPESEAGARAQLAGSKGWAGGWVWRGSEPGNCLSGEHQPPSPASERETPKRKASKQVKSKTFRRTASQVLSGFGNRQQETGNPSSQKGFAKIWWGLAGEVPRCSSEFKPKRGYHTHKDIISISYSGSELTPSSPGHLLLPETPITINVLQGKHLAFRF